MSSSTYNTLIPSSTNPRMIQKQPFIGTDITTPISFIYDKQIQQLRDCNSIGYKIDQNIFPLTENTPKIIHHKEAIRLLNSFQTQALVKIFIEEGSIILPLTVIILSLNLYWINLSPDQKGALINLIVLTGVVVGVVVPALTLANVINKYIKNKNETKNNLSRENDDPAKPNALVLMPMIFSDHNKSFCNNYNTIIGPLAKKYNIDLYYPLSVKHINLILQEKKYNHLLICGHGTPDSISFTPTFDLTTSDIPELNFLKLSKKTVIAIDSCFTGVVHGIGEKIAYFAKRRVFAPKTKSYPSFIEFSTDGSIKYTWLSVFSTDITRIIDPNEFTISMKMNN